VPEGHTVHRPALRHQRCYAGAPVAVSSPQGRTSCGLEPDYATLRKPGKDDSDLFMLHFNNLMVTSMGATAAANVTMQIHTVGEFDVCRVHVRPSGFPVDGKVVVDKAGQMIKTMAFYVRTSNSTLTLDDEEKAKYVLTRWPTG
jgi:hypothetical protein